MTAHSDTDFKTEFEQNSLLTVTAGSLAVTAIPVAKAPDWLVPSSLIIETIPYAAALEQDTYQPLISSALALMGEHPAEHLVVLHGNEPSKAIGLLISGTLESHHIKIADIKDSDDAVVAESKIDTDDTKNDYVFQMVLFNNQSYVIPDMMALSKHELLMPKNDE